VKDVSLFLNVLCLSSHARASGMKILFDHSSPFLLAHGGFQIQIEETKRALEDLGVTIEYLRWWDAEQRGDIIHFFGRPSDAYIDFAYQKNIRVVMSELLTGLGSRSAMALALQRQMIRLVRKSLPPAFWTKMGWGAYAKANRIIALTSWEAELMRRVFDAPASRVVVIPNGVADEFLVADESNTRRGTYLICTATITERKRILETAQAAIYAQTPLWVIGKPYSETDRYAQDFFALAKQNPAILRYEGPVQDRHRLAQAYREARGFVLLSMQESLSLSALEAAACECPLLLSDLPWARSVFASNAMYCPIRASASTAKILREFYDVAPQLGSSPKPMSWIEVARELKKTYEDLLSTSR
jgi:glycosyltransferase involved in cell wall biosynthesis